MFSKERRFARLGAAALAFSLLGAACASDGDGGTSAGSSSSQNSGTNEDGMSTSSGVQTQTVALDEGAPALLQTLTDLLDGHVYLASITVATGVQAGLDSPEFKAAAATLDQNSQDLAAAIESVYGPEAGKSFLKQWRAHIGFFVSYTEGKATGNEKLADKALTRLSNYKKDFSAFLDKATGGELPAEAAAGALQMHVDTLVEAIDAAIAGDADVFDKIYAAASEHMPMTASALAGAISTQFPDKFPTS